MIEISLAMDADERFHQKRMGLIKYALHNKHKIPLHKVKLNHKKRSVTVKGQVVVKTCEDGTLKYNQYHNIAEDVQNLMEKWLAKNSSQQL